MYYVTDMHAFVWYLTDSPQLSKKARDVFDSADNGKNTIIIPAIVLLECIDIVDKKKVRLDFEDILLKLSQASNFVISEISWPLILETNRIKGFKDIHDRVIVSTAYLFDADLISKDAVIKKFYKRTIW